MRWMIKKVVKRNFFIYFLFSSETYRSSEGKKL